MGIFKMFMNSNFCYIMLCLLLAVASFLYLYTSGKKKFILLFILVYAFCVVFSFSYFDYIFNSAFTFSLSSVRFYLVSLIVANIVMLITINFDISFIYKVINYLLFGISSCIFVINIFILVSSSFNLFGVEISDIIFFISLDVLVFISYFYLLLGIYIVRKVRCEISNYIERKSFYKMKLDDDVVLYDDVVVNNDIVDDVIYQNPNDVYENIINSDNFIIDGKDCSFIFKDPNKDNVIRNYYILLTDVNARLVNGYTIDENIRIYNILNRLNVKDINSLDLMSMEILSKIDIDEYNLLKGYINDVRDR